MPGMKSILVVMLGGAVGAASRYLIAWVSAAYISARYPVGTFAANMIGCFFIGVAFAAAERLQLFTPSARLFFMTGFLGALTTFSTYALESVQAFRSGDAVIAGINIIGNIVGGVALVLLGMWLAMRFFEG